MPEGVTPEDRLCLLLARGRFTSEVAQTATAQLRADPHWDLLFECAIRHGLIPLVYHRLRALEFPGVPPLVRTRFTDTFGVNAIRNDLLSQELARLLAVLSTAGVPLIPLKGMTLAESLYGDWALRVSADLDLLIPSEHLEECIPLLESCGYKAHSSNPSLIRLIARYGKDFALMREAPRQNYSVQLHNGQIWGGQLENQVNTSVWSEATPCHFRGIPAFAMSPEWEFLYLAVHAARHGLFPFKWLVDLDWIIARGALDWNVVREKATRFRWMEPVQSSLAACAALLETPVPEVFLPLPPVEIRNRDSGPLEIPRQTLFAFRLLPTFGQRLRFLAIRLFVPTAADCNFLQLPASLFWLYYFLRPFRLTIAAIGWLIQAGIGWVRRGWASMRAA